MNKKSRKQNELEQIENQIQALQRKKQELQRLFAKWEAQRTLSDQAAKEVIDLWRFKLQIGLPIRPIMAEKKKLVRYFPREIIDDVDMKLEAHLPVFISRLNGEIAVADELNRCLAEVNELLDEMERIRDTLKRREKPTKRMAWNTANKFLRIGLGTVLIGLDAPTVNWYSIVPGTVIILQAIESHPH